MTSFSPIGYEKFYVSLSDQSIEKRCEFPMFLFPLYDDNMSKWQSHKRDISGMPDSPQRCVYPGKPADCKKYFVNES